MLSKVHCESVGKQGYNNIQIFHVEKREKHTIFLFYIEKVYNLSVVILQFIYRIANDLSFLW